MFDTDLSSILLFLNEIIASIVLCLTFDFLKSENIFISPQYLKDIFVGCESLSWNSFFSPSVFYVWRPTWEEEYLNIPKS